MSSVAYLSEQLSRVLEERANEIARETGCVQRQRKFSGASLLQTWVFGWQQHPEASLEQLASVAQLHDVEVTDTAVHHRFTPKAAQFLHRVLEEACSLVVQAAQDVPVALLRRFSAVILEDSSSRPGRAVEAIRSIREQRSNSMCAGTSNGDTSGGQRSRMDEPRIGAALSWRRRSCVAVWRSRI